MNVSNANVNIKNRNTSRFLTLVTLLLFFAWAIGFFVYDFGNAIHLFLALATLAFIFQVLKDH